MVELAKREKDIKDGRLKSILFLRYEEEAVDTKAKEEEIKMSATVLGKKGKGNVNKEEVMEKKKEISGYIDLAQRFQTEDFTPYFRGDRLLLPRNGDLSFFNWKTQNPTVSDSRNFRVVANPVAGLLFRNKLDRKDINVDPLVVKIFPLI